jgi:hypothetical protein
MRTTWTVALLGVPLFSAPALPQLASSFALTCTYEGGKARFIVGGDYTKGKAHITRLDGSLINAHVSFDMSQAPPPKLAILVWGKGTWLGDWRACMW